MGRGGALRNQKALDFLELELNGCKPPDVGCWEPNLGSSRRVASAPNGWAISSPMQFTVYENKFSKRLSLSPASERCPPDSKGLQFKGV